MHGQRRLILDTILLGLVGAVGARLFTIMLNIASYYFLSAIAAYRPPGLPSEHGLPDQVIGPYGLWLIPVVTTLGGLISGFIVYTLAPEAEGHGTDTVVQAYHYSDGSIRSRVPPLKMVASAITIGSGGAAGREGPTALISAGIGSIYAAFTHRSEEERRLLVLIGMAAGLSAVFRSPIGTAIFAIEVLYSEMEFDSGALLYTMLASVIAYAVNGLFVGWQPLFQLPAGLAISNIFNYLWYVVLGVASGLVATLLPFVFYSLRDFFHILPLPSQVKPAVGGLGVGLIALGLPQVLGGGYGWIQKAIDGQLALQLLLILIFAKILAFSLTVSSGGSGGVFAPSLFVGAMLGAFLAGIFHQSSAAFTVVGMAAVFGAAARVPIATLLMVTEMTGSYDLLVPAALAVMLSYLIQVSFSLPLKYRSLYEAQVPSRSDSPAHHVEQLEAAIHLLSNRRAPLQADFSPVDLRALLASGVPLGLPDGKCLAIGVLRPKSPFANKPLQSSFPPENREQLEVIAVFRQGHTLLPNPKLVLQPGDRVLALTSPETWESLAAHFAPLRRLSSAAGARILSSIQDSHR